MVEIETALAKVNLYLHVTGRRADGFHLLDSLAVFGPATDTLSATRSDDLTLSLDGPFGATLSAEPDNLVLRAARALAAATGHEAGAALRLTKRLPVASGIGGGSADAAAALRLLNRLWNTGLNETSLAAIAAPLGADIPVCVASRPARMQGVGEIILAAPSLPECGLLLVNPGVPLATPAVFRARQGGFSPAAELPASWPDAKAMAADLRLLGNDLEAPALALCPVIAKVLAALSAQPGCLLARMSGSGATCFGVFASAAAAETAALAMPREWWAAGGGLYGAGPPSLHRGTAGV
ncbi:MAG: 4-(cytidine 5-diphospho)-2-C-methyl-D-erythritol kinase [Rubritepida sp.]|nr:4-(cytidine 5-diphospho)-2-C-methyl-D-erythritol kinase [Rubritepida sp.]